jgi:WD40 repeat protein
MALADLRPLQSWNSPGEACGAFSHDLRLHIVCTGGEVVLEGIPPQSAGAVPAIVALARWPLAGAVDVRFSRDDRLVGIFTNDWRVHVFTIQGQRLGEFAGAACDFLPDDSLGVITSDGVLVIYDARSGAEPRRIPWVKATRMDFSPDGRRLATMIAGHSAEVYVGEPNSGLPPVRVVHAGVVYRASWNRRGTVLATCGFPEEVFVWDVSSLDRIPQPTVLKGHQSAVTDVAFSHGGDLLASTGWDGTVRLWSVATWEPLVRLFWPGADLKFSPDDCRLGCESASGSSILEVVPGRECRTLSAPTQMGEKQVAFSPDGSVIGCTGGSIVRFWNTADWSVAADIAGMEITSCIRFQRDGLGVIVRSGGGLWRVPLTYLPPASPDWPSGGAAPGSFPQIGPTAKRVLAIPGDGHFDLASDGLHAAVAGQGESIICDLRDPERRTMLPGAGAAMVISMSPDMHWVAGGTFKEGGDRRVRIWDAHSGELVHHLPTGEMEQNLAFSPDGRWLVTSGLNDYRFWRAGDWMLDHTISRPDAKANGKICFSPDSRIMAMSHRSKGVRLINPDTGAEIATFEDEGEQVPVTFSPDGRFLVAQGQSDTLRVWDLSLIERQLGEMELGFRLTPRVSAQREARPER